MCRIEIDKEHIEKVIKAAYNKEELSDIYEYKFLHDDTQSKNKGNAHNGYSILLFGARTGKVAQEGVLKKYFFD